jgi:thiopurine S-methyltransferase
MKQEFWQEKWQANEIGFHQDVVHPLLVKYLATLSLEKGSRVFVPLCGKSRDIICVREQGYEVIGLELSELAVESFFSENDILANSSESSDFNHFKARSIEILCGDFFSLTQKLLGNISAVFDRAALIALPEEMRIAYVKKMQTLLMPGTQILLISLEYEKGLVNSPPHTVLETEVTELYSDWCDVYLLERAVAEVKGKPCHELVYRLTVR